MYPLRLPFDGNIKITQKFGANPDTYAQFDLDGHNGIDYGTPLGTEIKAVASATVRYVGYDPEGYGNYIRLDHHVDGCNFQTLYAHSDQVPYFKAGASVKKGDVIMLSGNCGYSTGPHLHFGLREIDINGNTLNEDNGYKGYIDPQPWLDLGVNVIPDWAYDSVEWAINNKILDSWTSAQQKVSQTDFKYTLAVMLYRYYLNIDKGSSYNGTYLTGSWPSWSNEAVNWAISKKILDSAESVMQPVSLDAFKYTLAVMIYRYYLNVAKGSKYTGTCVTGTWPLWANEGVNWALSLGILDSAETVMQPVAENAFKYTLAVMLERYNEEIMKN
ncbi:MAG: peptidase M23 family protein [Candidatus Peregrinibacteria bacterium GW2011_GWF2_33_10]|nr:MAG: peptidase M23 family protein [Candidatus Peregrinibacteria bacterium GW2011_GWF2_33_10]OGJ43941.1 MAG: hypothetical protein A2272_04920 [Candidatus Peregrinibacteria bacterium RIFOXYA12_FULL_33_12]OGJ46022.1 MAG: hypothetical protein A2263_03315 [Candidatus Peregrinibacteria bacterium RIFOXYA2_FULL_33_21]OGJ51727.1 MAG: hypothetical protein A2307_04345 [Candidatus Peregrinibacteria bacterium RIFOXYB2_FULL_33_20]